MKQSSVHQWSLPHNHLMPSKTDLVIIMFTIYMLFHRASIHISFYWNIKSESTIFHINFLRYTIMKFWVGLYVNRGDIRPQIPSPHASTADFGMPHANLPKSPNPALKDRCRQDRRRCRDASIIWGERGSDPAEDDGIS